MGTGLREKPCSPPEPHGCCSLTGYCTSFSPPCCRARAPGLGCAGVVCPAPGWGLLIPGTGFLSCSEPYPSPGLSLLC